MNDTRMRLFKDKYFLITGGHETIDIKEFYNYDSLVLYINKNYKLSDGLDYLPPITNGYFEKFYFETKGRKRFLIIKGCIGLLEGCEKNE